MGKVLVLYDSKSGNTEKMANLVAEGAAQVSDIEVRAAQNRRRYAGRRSLVRRHGLRQSHEYGVDVLADEVASGTKQWRRTG